MVSGFLDKTKSKSDHSPDEIFKPRAKPKVT